MQSSMPLPERAHMLGYLIGEVTSHTQGPLQAHPIGFQWGSTPVTNAISSPDRDLPPLYGPTEGHGMVIAGTGAGKTRSVAIPLLLTDDRSTLIVNDLKGELYAVTAPRQRAMGKAVYCLDFSGLTAGPYHRFNPLDTFGHFTRPEDIEIEAQSLADRLSFVSSGLSEAFWDAQGINLVAAMLAAWMVIHPPGQGNLRYFLKQLFTDDLIYSLATLLDQHGKKIPPMAYQDLAAFLQLPDITRGGVAATAQSYLKSLMAEPVLRATDASDFSLKDVRDGKPMTIYLVFPPDRMVSHSGLLRIWIGALLKAVTSRQQIPQNRTIFLLDECAQLGSFQYLETVITLCRGYGVSCLTFWQDLQQIKDRYPGWQTLVNNCSTLQFFGCKNHLVAKGVEELTGIAAARIAALPPDQQLVVLNGRNLLAKRLDYLRDPQFAGLYAPNPYYAQLTPSDNRRSGGSGIAPSV